MAIIENALTIIIYSISMYIKNSALDKACTKILHSLIEISKEV